MTNKELKNETFTETLNRHYLFFTAGLGFFETMVDFIKEIVKKLTLRQLEIKNKT